MLKGADCHFPHASTTVRRRVRSGSGSKSSLMPNRRHLETVFFIYKGLIGDSAKHRAFCIWILRQPKHQRQMLIYVSSECVTCHSCIRSCAFIRVLIIEVLKFCSVKYFYIGCH